MSWEPPPEVFFGHLLPPDALAHSGEEIPCGQRSSGACYGIQHLEAALCDPESEGWMWAERMSQGLKTQPNGVAKLG